MLTRFWCEQSRLERKCLRQSRTKPMVGFANWKIRLDIHGFSARHLDHNASLGRTFFTRFCVAGPLQVGVLVGQLCRLVLVVYSLNSAKILVSDLLNAVKHTSSFRYNAKGILLGLLSFLDGSSFQL